MPYAYAGGRHKGHQFLSLSVWQAWSYLWTNRLLYLCIGLEFCALFISLFRGIDGLVAEGLSACTGHQNLCPRTDALYFYPSLHATVTRDGEPSGSVSFS